MILEGIFDAERYEHMFEEILVRHPDENFFFYYGVSNDETLRRHQTKPNKDDFGEPEIRSWYKKDDYLKCQKEIVVPNLGSLETTIEWISKIIKEPSPT